MEIFFSLDKAYIHGRELVKTGKISLEIFSAFMPELEYINNDRISFGGQQSCDSQSITAVIAFAAKNREGVINVSIFLQPIYAPGSSSLHEINGSDGLIPDSIFIPQLY